MIFNARKIEDFSTAFFKKKDGSKNPTKSTILWPEKSMIFRRPREKIKTFENRRFSMPQNSLNFEGFFTAEKGEQS